MAEGTVMGDLRQPNSLYLTDDSKGIYFKYEIRQVMWPFALGTARGAAVICKLVSGLQLWIRSPYGINCCSSSTWDCRALAVCQLKIWLSALKSDFTSLKSLDVCFAFLGTLLFGNGVGLICGCLFYLIILVTYDFFPGLSFSIQRSSCAFAFNTVLMADL